MPKSNPVFLKKSQITQEHQTLKSKGEPTQINYCTPAFCPSSRKHQKREEKPSSHTLKMKHADLVQGSQQKCLLAPRQEQLAQQFAMGPGKHSNAGCSALDWWATTFYF